MFPPSTKVHSIASSFPASVDTDAVGNRLHDGILRAVLQDILLAACRLAVVDRGEGALAVLACQAAQLVTVGRLAQLARPAPAGVTPAARVFARVFFRFAEEDWRKEWERRDNVL